jgi:hypothetical protein
MWNVHAVMEWKVKQQGTDPPQHPDWWRQSKEDAAREYTSQNHGLSQQPTEQAAGVEMTDLGTATAVSIKPTLPLLLLHHHHNRTLLTPFKPLIQDTQQTDTCFDSYISNFAGQGRQMGYNGLAYAVLVSVYDTPNDNRRVQRLDVIVDRTFKRLKGRRPASWWALSLISLALVWLEIGMAFMISYNVPTVGIGCRSMSYIIYGGLSTLPWIIHLLPGFKHPGVKRRAACYLICLLSTLCLIFITFAAVS